MLFEPLEEGGYNVIVPAIPEICTFGETLEEAREMGKDAIRCYLEIKLGSGMHIDLIQVLSGNRVTANGSSLLLISFNGFPITVFGITLGCANLIMSL